MSEEPRYGAPSPADGPTTPGTGAISRAELAGDRQAATGPPSGPLPGAPAEYPTIPDGAAAARPRARVSPGRTRIGGFWIGMILGAVVLVFLLVFILQNLDPARVVFLGLEATLPLGIWLLFAAIAGVLLLAIPGLGRMVQWRRAAKRTGRTR
ncbi:LapA family protein [Actinomycetospora straminea]|nr:lipopolysaccharide assembly protein LapA domain-containing protein [Actinomycetospora straminea]MDD7931691.1 lipopolysaccharide assembly protein LapA domain-containing protein [Actinomycetospora straminea]